MILINGLKNHNEFYTDLYLSDVLEQDLRGVLNSWREEKERTGKRSPWEDLRSLREQYFEVIASLEKEKQLEPALRRQQDFLADLVRILGYDYRPQQYELASSIWQSLKLWSGMRSIHLKRICSSIDCSEASTMLRLIHHCRWERRCLTAL